MKANILILIVICLMCITGCGIGNPNKNYTNAAYTLKSIETLKDSKGRAHRIVVFCECEGVCAIDLDANTYK